MVYASILENPDGRFYIGHFDNLEVRLANHNRSDKPAVKFTRAKPKFQIIQL